jgi:hypothetical protein
MENHENDVLPDEMRGHETAAGVRWDAAPANDHAHDPYDVCFESPESAPDETHLGLALQSKKHDNLSLGETLVRIGLLEPHEMLDVRIAQARDEDLGDSLVVASAIRSRLGEMLLRSKQITSAQLESALELQRKRGGLLGEILVSQGWLDRGTLDAALAAQALSGRRAA